jgi:hypothetical protein
VGELSYTVPHLSSFSPVPYKQLSGRQQYEVESLTLDGEVCDEEEVVQAVSHNSPGTVSSVT